MYIRSSAIDFPVVYKNKNYLIVPFNINEIVTTEEDEEIITYNFCLYKEKFRSNKLHYIKNIVWKMLEYDLHNHIYPEYNQGSQSSIQGYANKAKDEDKFDIYEECKKIQEWIDSCLTYYYDKKDEIFYATSVEDVTVVNWNFIQNVPKPNNLLKLREIKEMFK